jgi:hypothetical protein
MASTGRSNSSLSIRQALMSSKRFDDVNHAVSISAYFNVAEKLYDEAKKSNEPSIPIDDAFKMIEAKREAK